MQQTLFKLFQDHDLLKRSWSANRGWKRNWNAINIVLSSLSRHPFCLLPGRNQAAKGLQPHLLSQRRTHVSRGTHVSLETLANLPSLGRHPFCLVPRRNQAAKGSTAPSSVWRGTHTTLEPLSNLSSLGWHPFCLVPRRNQTAKGLQPHLLSQRGTHASRESLANLSSLDRHPFCLVPRRNQAAMGLRPHLLQWRRHFSLWYNVPLATGRIAGVCKQVLHPGGHKS